MSLLVEIISLFDLFSSPTRHSAMKDGILMISVLMVSKTSLANGNLLLILTHMNKLWTENALNTPSLNHGLQKKEHTKYVFGYKP